VPDRKTSQERQRRAEQALQAQMELKQQRDEEAAAEAAAIVTKYARRTTDDSAADARARFLARKQARTSAAPLPTADDDDA
jgi:hypothetical protein